MQHVRAVIEEGMVKGLHLGAQVYVSFRGQILVDFAVGASRPRVEMRADTINLWMSSGKPITAVAIAQCFERGLLDWDDRVAKHIPEFGVKGKESITIRHVLTHTGGFRAAIGLKWDDPFDVAVQKICQTALEPRWIPGITAGYHPATGWYILGEIVRRLDGRSFDQYVREMIFLPLGMANSWMGMPSDVHQKLGEQVGLIYGTKAGLPGEAEVGNTATDAAAIRPGSNIRGPVRELGLFYHALARSRPNPALKQDTVDLITAPKRVGAFDLTFKHIVDMGFGFILNSNRYGEATVPYGYGLKAGARTFGHSGQESSCGFYDPDNELVVAWVCNGMPGAATADERHRQINAAIYADAGL